MNDEIIGLLKDVQAECIEAKEKSRRLDGCCHYKEEQERLIYAFATGFVHGRIDRILALLEK